MGDAYDNGYKFPPVGIGNVGSYQVAGKVYVTGTVGVTHTPDTEVRVQFPSVARTLTVLNLSTNATIYVHFNSNNPAVTGGSKGVITGSHYIPLDSKEDSLTMNVKCKEVYITTPAANSGQGTPNADWRVFAELTHIPTKAMYELTGSGLTDSQLDP